MSVILIGSGEDECEVTVVMDEENEDADVPLVGEIAEHDQEYRQSVMKSILKEVSFSSDEDMPEETTEVLAELSNVEDLHLEGRIRNVGGLLSQRVRTSMASQPSRHEAGTQHNLVGPYRAQQVVDDRVSPFD